MQMSFRVTRHSQTMIGLWIMKRGLWTKRTCLQTRCLPVVNSTKTLNFIPNFLNFFRRLYAPIFNHVTSVLILAKDCCFNQHQDSGVSPIFPLSIRISYCAVASILLDYCSLHIPSIICFYGLIHVSYDFSLSIVFHM
jgi:hypothetical protein